MDLLSSLQMTDKLIWSTSEIMIDIESPKHSDENLSECLFNYHESHVDCQEFELSLVEKMSVCVFYFCVVLCR